MSDPVYRPRNRNAAPRGGNRFLVTFLLFAVIVMATLQVRAWWVGNAMGAAVPRAITPRGDLGADELATIRLFEETSPGVVSITTTKTQQDYWTRNIYRMPVGTGSGFVWDTAGHVVTNFHVLNGSSAWQVTLWDGSAWDAELVGHEVDKDLAVLRIDAPPELLRPIRIGESSNLLVGQKALAIGNPFGFDQTLTTGVISALGQEIESMSRRPIQGVIQTDAAINPGNSGGPLLDSAGRMIGVNTAIYSPTGSSAGIGFAVPVDTVNYIVPQLIEHGKVIKPSLGIVMVDENLAKSRLGIEGVVVRKVVKGSGAEKAGILPARRVGRAVVFDVIKKFDGREIKGSKDLFRALDSKTVGDTVKISVLRGDETVDLDIKLSAINN